MGCKDCENCCSCHIVAPCNYCLEHGLCCECESITCNTIPVGSFDRADTDVVYICTECLEEG